jgi:signal transduction histidine kinase
MLSSTLVATDKLDVSSGGDAQRLMEMGRLSASLIHEISSPLTAALLHLGEAEGESDTVQQARRSLVRLKRYVEAARHQLWSRGTDREFCVNSQMQEIKRLVMPQAKSCNLILKFEPPSVQHFRIHGDPIKFQQVLINLINNAMEAYPTETVNPVVTVRIAGLGNRLSISVVDHGRGIDKRQLPRLFEPFYTTKQSAKHGLGIGLVIVKQYVTEHFGGNISVSSSKTDGTCFNVKFKTKPCPNR